MAQLTTPAHIAVTATETSVVAELSSGVYNRVTMHITNVSTASAEVYVYRYDSASAETATASNAILYNRTLLPNSDEILTVDVTLGPGWVIGASASTSSAIVIHTDTIIA